MNAPAEPKAWSRVSLGESNVATIVMGQSPPSSTYNLDGTGLPFFQGKVDFGLRNPVPRVWCSTPLKIAAAGDVLLSVRAPVGAVNLASETCCIGRGLAALHAGAMVEPEFLYFHLMTRAAELDSLGTGAIFRAINRDTLQSLELGLPSKIEQSAIAGVLTTLQAAAEVGEKRVTALKALKAATMAKVFHEGLDREPLRLTEIGEIPESWVLTPLGALFDVQQGKALSRGKESGDISRPFLRTSNVFWGEMDFRNLDSMLFTKEEIEKLTLAKDDLLVCEGGDIGRTAIWTGEREDCLFQNHLHRLRVKEEGPTPAFFMYWLEAALLHFGLYGGAENRTTIPNLSGARLKGFLVPRPKGAEQEGIAAAIEAVETRLRVAERTLSTLSEVLSRCIGPLITGELRVTPLFDLAEAFNA